MATTTTPTPIAGLNAQDQAFMDGFYDNIKDSPLALKLYNTWGTALSKKPTYDDKLAYIRTIINNPDIASKYRAKFPDLGVKWLADSNPGIVDSKGDAFSTDFYKGIISGDTKTSTANSTALKTAKTKVATESAKLANPKATPAELATIVADIVNGSSTKPYNPATLTKAVSSTPSASLYKAGSMSADKLKSTYGNILDPDTGKPLFSDEYLKNVASATTAGGVQGFNDTLSKVASKVLASQTGSNYLVQSDADKADALTNLLKNPGTLASGTESLYKKSAESKTGINGLLPVGSFKDDKGNFVYNGGEIQPKDMSEFVQTYNNQGVANRGAYVAPTYNTDTKMYESKSKSPYASALTSLLGSTKNPFASDYKSSLAQPDKMTSTQLANISKPFEKNATARDIINLQNSAGLPTGNELTKDSSLSKNLLGLYQTNPDGSAINSPWVADTEDMVIPTTTKPDIDTSTELVQLDPGGLLREQGVIDPNLVANQDTAAGIDTLTGKPTVAGNAGIDTLVEKDTGQPKKSYYDPVNNPNGDWLYIAGVEEPVSRYGVGPDGTEHDYATEGARIWNNQILTPKEFETVTDYYKNRQLVHSDNGKIQSGFDQAKLALWNSQFAAPTAVTDTPVVTNTNGVNLGTSAEIEARRIATDKLIAEQQAAAQAAAFKTAQDKTNDINQAAINQQIANDQQKVNESRDYLKSQNFDMSVFDANPNSQYRPVNTNAGIVTPSINNVVSEKNMNTFALGPNGETGIPTTLSSANTVNQNAGLTSLTGQQLENQAVNAGYQGDYTDTAAMQGYLSSLPR